MILDPELQRRAETAAAQTPEPTPELGSAAAEASDAAPPSPRQLVDQLLAHVGIHDTEGITEVKMGGDWVLHVTRSYPLERPRL